MFATESAFSVQTALKLLPDDQTALHIIDHLYSSANKTNFQKHFLYIFYLKNKRFTALVLQGT